MNIKNITPRIQSAIDLGRAGHDSIGQKRKYTLQPYWIHTEEVAAIVSEVTNDENIIIAAVFHDWKEDLFPKNPLYSDKDIIDNFGSEVMGLVDELTNVYTKEAYPNLNRHQRHIMERARQAQISPDAQTIKLADLISNTKDLIKQDPGFAQIYLVEKLLLLPLLRKGNDQLLMRAYSQIESQLEEHGWQLRMHIPEPKITEILNEDITKVAAELAVRFKEDMKHD